MRFLSSVLVTLQLLGSANAECPNACSSHGKCGSYDMCQCFRNWMSNDCSERICQFGLAHVDSPKGDLDASSDALSGPGSTVVANSFMYPFGTTEQFPQMVDSDDTLLDNTGHYYMECSNKGLCDRSSGSCECFPGYEGSACQRASCPANEEGVCSGHGTCNTIEYIAAMDHGNVYDLWDQEATMGCVCDAGYFGPDCAQRQCKYGVDPLYVDDSVATPRVANWTYTLYSTTAPGPSSTEGNYSIIFYDVFGEDWETDPIQFKDVAFEDEPKDQTGHCPWVIDALEKLPNDVIPGNSVLCSEGNVAGNPYSNQMVAGAGFTQLKHIILIFPSNPGNLKQIEINTHLDGNRPTLHNDQDPANLKSQVYADGFSGEFEDLVPDQCDGVEVQIRQTDSHIVFDDADTNAATNLMHHELVVPEDQKNLLKRCLGYSVSGSVGMEVFNWDYGDYKNPHLIKLVDSSKATKRLHCNATYTTFNNDETQEGFCEDTQPAGFYLPLIYSGASQGKFVVFGNVGGLGSYMTDTFDVEAKFHLFTTKGYLQRVQELTTDGSVPGAIYTKALGSEEAGADVYWSYDKDNTIDCESKALGDGDAHDCLQKGDNVMFVNMKANGFTTAANLPLMHNMYKVEKIYISRDVTPANDNVLETEAKIILDKSPNFVEPSTSSDMVAYKFYPSGSVEYVSECAGRGNCERDTGLCDCFTGYTSDDCSAQNTLAM